MAKRMTVLGGYDLDESGRPIRKPINTTKQGDYGSNPMPGGMYRMVPRGDIVDLAERNRRLT